MNTFMRGYLAALGLGLAAACGGATPAPETPEAEVDEPMATASAEEDPQAGHELDVGMEFDEESEADADSNEEHGPPPTQAYSPATRLKDGSEPAAETPSTK